jgi:hypothetical protein
MTPDDTAPKRRGPKPTGTVDAVRGKGGEIIGYRPKIT